MQQGHISLKKIETLVLDEADRMLDMGFINDIKKILSNIQKKSQTLLFSATMSKDITYLTKKFLVNPVRIEVITKDSTLERIKQKLFFVEKRKKISLLLYLLKKNLDHVLIFTRTKAQANRVTRELKKNRIPAEAIHSDKTQAQRRRALSKFKEGGITLVATDIAARGIDVTGISHVINYDLPNDAENYIHRIGRTARAGANGEAYSFCDETEKDYLNAIEYLIKKRLKSIKHPFHSEYAKHSTQKPQQGRNKFSKRNYHSPDEDLRSKEYDPYRIKKRFRKL
jgi:ATP-dependent RNA helicase RhlE